MMKSLLKKYIDNDSNFFLMSVMVILFIIVLGNSFPNATVVPVYFFILVGGIKGFRESVKWANRVWKQCVWLLMVPIFFVFLPIVIVDPFFPNLFLKDTFFVPIFILSFIIGWVIAVFVFNFNQIKVAIHIVNAFFISILSLTFISYFTTDVIYNLLNKGLIEKDNSSYSDMNTAIDLLLKSLTIPYILAGIWASVAISCREHLISKAKMKNTEY